MRREDLIIKHRAYQSVGALLLGVTLSTYVQSESYARSDRFRKFWDFHFIYRVKKCLPVNAKIDYDWVTEQSPDGYFHMHGILAVEEKYASRLWTENGLRRKLVNALHSFKTLGNYRQFRVNKCLVEPIVDLESWVQYISKQSHVSTE